MRPLATERVAGILILLSQGLSTRKAAIIANVSHQTVYRIRCEKGQEIAKPKAGRPPVLTSRNKRSLVRNAISGSMGEAVTLWRNISNITGLMCSYSTVRNALKDEGLIAVNKKKKPKLRLRHIKLRLEFAKKYQNWTEEDWGRVIFSDETKINILGSNGRKWVWKRPRQMISPKEVIPTLKFGGGNLMMWGCISCEGVGHACRIDGDMNAELYTQILQGELLESIDYFGRKVENIIFQQDNDPKHTSRLAYKWFNSASMEVLDWPAQSPDLNPIENLWSYLKRKLASYDTPADSIHQLWLRVEKEWEMIPIELCKTLINSMPCRIQAVLKSKGRYTKY
jgi:transposase